LALDYDRWSTLAIPTWITHIWGFSYSAGLHIECLPEECWLPKVQRERDFFIMDLASPHYAKEQLAAINWCRLYLKVLTISDMSLGNGTKVHPACIEVVGHTGRSSTLNWPEVPPPSPSAITMWKAFLYTKVMDRFGTLTHRVGRWITDAVPLQSNPFFWHDEALYKITAEGPKRLVAAVGVRSRHPKFLDCILPLPLPAALPEDLLADVWFHDGIIEVVDVYQRIFTPMGLAADPPIPENETFPDYVRRSTSANEKRLLGRVTLPQLGYDHLCSALRDRTLLGVSDGSVKNGQGTHAWVLTSSASSPHRIMGAGPVDGVPKSMHSYRSELQGQVAVSLMVVLLC